MVRDFCAVVVWDAAGIHGAAEGSEVAGRVFGSLAFCRLRRLPMDWLAGLAGLALTSDVPLNDAAKMLLMVLPSSGRLGGAWNVSG